MFLYIGLKNITASTFLCDMFHLKMTSLSFVLNNLKPVTDRNSYLKCIILDQLINMAWLYHNFLHSIITASSGCPVMLPKWLITCFSAIQSWNCIKCSLYCGAIGTAAGILLVLRLDWQCNYGSLPQVKGGTILSCGRPLLTASIVCPLQPLLMRRSSVATEVCSLHTFTSYFAAIQTVYTQWPWCWYSQHHGQSFRAGSFGWPDWACKGRKTWEII